MKDFDFFLKCHTKSLFHSVKRYKIISKINASWKQHDEVLKIGENKNLMSGDYHSSIWELIGLSIPVYIYMGTSFIGHINCSKLYDKQIYLKIILN